DGWVFAGDQRPLWWSIRPEATPAEHVETRIESAEQDGMLDLYGNGAPTSQPREATGLGTAIIATPRYADQKKGLRRTPPDEAVAALVDELAAAPSTRLPLSRVSQLLATPAARTGRVAGVVAQLLNVEGFEVLRLEDDTAILDATLAREQFEVHGCAPPARASPPGGATTSSERCAAAPSHPRGSTSSPSAWTTSPKRCRPSSTRSATEAPWSRRCAANTAAARPSSPATSPRPRCAAASPPPRCRSPRPRPRCTSSRPSTGGSPSPCAPPASPHRPSAPFSTPGSTPSKRTRSTPTPPWSPPRSVWPRPPASCSTPGSPRSARAPLLSLWLCARITKPPVRTLPRPTASRHGSAASPM